jgi:Protein of unknown function (DUF2950)
MAADHMVVHVTNGNFKTPTAEKFLETEKTDMCRLKLDFRHSLWGGLLDIATVAVILTVCLPGGSKAQEKGQKTFSSAEKASQALVTAIQSNDEKAILNVLGQDAKQIVSSGDEVEDKQNRANFVEKYGEMHRLVKEPDGTIVLYIGAENWPTPIPLVNKVNAWYFDTEAGKKEILFRRIGWNEISAIRVCQELVAAEKEYYATEHNEYAQKILSDPGQHNGLYWRAAPGEPKSPIGPLVASAVAEGYARRPNGAPTAYRGYYYRILPRRGKNSPGGAKSYILNREMTEGFAFLAYPAEYRSSGVMTFVVDENGVVYQKDLGNNTAVLARAMKKFNVDETWHQAEGLQKQILGE